MITYIRLGLTQAEWAAKMYPVERVDRGGASAPSPQARRAAVASLIFPCRALDLN